MHYAIYYSLYTTLTVEPLLRQQSPSNDYEDTIIDWSGWCGRDKIIVYVIVYYNTDISVYCDTVTFQKIHLRIFER